MLTPRHKMAIINWIAIYPLITVILWVSRPIMQELPLYVSTLIISLVLTTAMNFLVMPLMVRLFANWIRPRTPHMSKPQTTDGTAH